MDGIAISPQNPDRNPRRRGGDDSKRRDLDDTLAGLRALQREAKDRLDRALVEETKRGRSKNGK